MTTTDQQPQEPFGEVAALDPLPDDRSERLAHLREIALTNAVGYPLCPECGESLEGRDAALHARNHWGADPNANSLSPEAKRRYAYVTRLGQQSTGRTA